MTFSWSVRLRQIWDELFTGRYERYLIEDNQRLRNRASQLEDELNQLKLAIMPLTSELGAAYARAKEPPRKMIAGTRVPGSWEDIASWEEQDGQPVRKEAEAAEGRAGAS